MSTGTLEGLLRLSSGSPVWVSGKINVPQPINTLFFDYKFLSNTEGLLSVFFDNQVVYKADERYASAGVNAGIEAPIGKIEPGVHSVSFRIDPFTDTQSVAEISNIKIGNVTVSIEPLPPVECLFNWAEKNYPSLFAPAGSPTAVWNVYTYRHYAATNSYVGVSSADNHVYYLGPDGNLQDEGLLSKWLPLAGCQ